MLSLPALSLSLSPSLCIAFYFCFHDPTFKLLVLLLRYPPLCARGCLSLLMPIVLLHLLLLL